MDDVHRPDAPQNRSLHPAGARHDAAGRLDEGHPDLDDRLGVNRPDVAPDAQRNRQWRMDCWQREVRGHRALVLALPLGVASPLPGPDQVSEPQASEHPDEEHPDEELAWQQLPSELGTAAYLQPLGAELALQQALVRLAWRQYLALVQQALQHFAVRERQALALPQHLASRLALQLV